MATFLVNGIATASVDAGDRGLAYGDGVFRTLAVRAGRILNRERHFPLLAHDCARLGLAAPDAAVLAGEIARVAPGDATVRVTVTRGAGGRGYRYEPGLPATRIVAAYPPFADAAAAREGVRVRRCALALSEQPRLAGVKSLNRLENVLARAEWSDPAIREGLLADAAGRLVEGTMANVFLGIGDRLVTPALTRCGVSGAQRARVLDFARAEGIACEVRDVDFGELEGASEVFLANSLIGLWPVVALDAWRWPPGALARHLQRRIEADDAAPG